MTPGIEVAICTHNGASRLPQVLRALSIQTLAPQRWCVLVVDNASTDDIAGSAQDAWTRTDVVLRVVNEPNPGVKMARLRALAASGREFLCFCDDDNLLAPDYLEKAVSIMDGLPLAGALGGRGEPASEIALPEWFEVAAPGYAVGPQADAEGPISDTRGYLYGAGMVIRRSAWEGIRRSGFEPRLVSREGSGLNSGEDNEICLMLRLMGWKIQYSPELVFRHLIAARKLDEHYCRALYRGFGEATVVLNAYRDFVLGRASVRRWRACALARISQSWVARAKDRFLPEHKGPLSKADLRREIAAGFAAGCRKNSRKGSLLTLYHDIASWLTQEAGRIV